MRHPEFLAHSATGRTVMIAEPDDTFAVIDLLLVNGLEPINGMSRAPREGSESS